MRVYICRKVVIPMIKSSLPDTYKPFPVDLEHLMENIKDQYVNLSIQQAVIVENVDNCVDEHYTSIYFNKPKDDTLKILMLGDGMNKRTFWNVLPKIVATTKIPGKKVGALGRYGWGMKVCMCVADHILVETKKNGFHDAQSWKLIKGIPNRRREKPERKRARNFTAITVKLVDKYHKEIGLDFVKETLQEFYPSILNKAKVVNRYGEKRILRMYADSKTVPPPSKIDFDKKRPLSIKIDGQKATGYVYLSKKPLNKEDTGIAIIVHGRKIMRDFFGAHGNMDRRITGYIHADFLIEDIAGDKTSLRRSSSRWKLLSGGASKQLSKFMKEIGAIREEKLPQKMIKRVHEEINNLIKNFPELQELAKKSGISISGKVDVDVLIKKKGGDISSELEEGSERARGIEAGSEGGKGVPVSSGEEAVHSPTEKKGKSSAVKAKRKRRRGLLIYPRPFPDVKSESWFSPEGVIIVNSSFPTYEKAEKMHARTLEYHMVRCCIEALLNHLVDTEAMERKEAMEYKNEVLSKWGELK